MMEERSKSLLMNIKKYKKGDILYKQGDKSTELYILNSGKVDVYVDDIYIATISEKGAIIGESSLLLNQTRSATLKVVEDSEFMVIPSEYIDNVILENPAIGLNLLKIIITRLRNTTKQLVHLQKVVFEYERKIQKLQKEKSEQKEFMLGELFYKTGIISKKELDEVLKIKKSYEKKGIKKSIGEILIEKGYATMFQVMQLIKLQKELKNE